MADWRKLAMRTDITKINEQSPHQELTEGLMVFALTAAYLLLMACVGILIMTIVRDAAYV